MAWPNFRGRGLVGINSVAAKAHLYGVQVKPFVGYCLGRLYLGTMR